MLSVSDMMCTYKSTLRRVSSSCLSYQSKVFDQSENVMINEPKPSMDEIVSYLKLIEFRVFIHVTIFHTWMNWGGAQSPLLENVGKGTKTKAGRDVVFASKGMSPTIPCLTIVSNIWKIMSLGIFFPQM